MELASQECCLHSVWFIHRYMIFVLVIITLHSHDCINSIMLLCLKEIEVD